MTAAILGLLHAQTNETPNTNTSTNVNTNAVNQILALVTTNAPAAKPQLQEIVIHSDGPLNINQTEQGLRAIYHEHVRVDSPALKLRCEWLAAILGQIADQPTNIVAETNVVIDASDDKAQQIHGTGDKAVYSYSVQNGVTNKTVTLTGKPAHLEITKPKLSQFGDTIILDLIHGALSVPTSPTTKVLGNFSGTAVGTNAPVAEANSPLSETNLPPTATNQTTAPK
jgi:lipopolysaccharide export system protein LptA